MPEPAAPTGKETYLGEFMKAAAPLGKYLLNAFCKNLAMSHLNIYTQENM